MKLKLRLKKQPQVLNDIAPELIIYYKNNIGQFDVLKITFQKLWCWIAGHRFGLWEDTKYTSGSNRVCERCRDHWEIN